MPRPLTPGSALRVVCAPPPRLLGRLRLPLKFLLILAVLITPLGFVIHRYIGEKTSSADFSSPERTGMSVIRPLFCLEVAMVQARTAAASGAAVNEAAVAAAVDAVDATTHRRCRDRHRRCVADDPDSDPRCQRRSDAATGDGRRATGDGSGAFEAWSAAVDSVMALISSASDNANLTLDPDIVSYYLTDVVMIKLPLLTANLGAQHDLTILAAAGKGDHGTEQARAGLRVTDAAGAVATELGLAADASAVDQVASATTASRDQLATVTDVATGGGLQSIDAANTTLSDQLERLIQRRVDTILRARDTTLCGSASSVSSWQQATSPQR